MGIGLGIVLIVVGAILAFAVDYSVQGVDLELIGFILLGAGALALVLGLISNQQSNTTTHREVVDRRDNSARRDRGYDDQGY